MGDDEFTKHVRALDAYVKQLRANVRENMKQNLKNQLASIRLEKKHLQCGGRIRELESEVESLKAEIERLRGT